MREKNDHAAHAVGDGCHITICFPGSRHIHLRTSLHHNILLPSKTLVLPIKYRGRSAAVNLT